MNKFWQRGRKGEGFKLKKVLIVGLIIFGFVSAGRAEEPTTNFNEVQKELQILELNLEKAILKIDTSEKAMLQKHFDVCENIEKRFKDVEMKKRGSKISKKQRLELEAKLAMEYQTIHMVKQLNVLSREEKKREFETQVQLFFDKYDVYLSNQ